jgi:hypothetical protein
MADLIASQVKALRRTRAQLAPDTMPAIMALSDSEAALRMSAGDSAGAAATLRTQIAREALSSTTSTGWQRLAELHMTLYYLALKGTAEPDYKKGLTHLSEWWKLHEGQSMPKRSECNALIEFARCYHGLDQLVDASRAVIKLVQVGKSMRPSDCPEKDVSATHDWLYETIFGFDKLHVFLDPNAIFSAPPGVTLGWGDRVIMHQIMTEAKENDRRKHLNHMSNTEMYRKALELLESWKRTKNA